MKKLKTIEFCFGANESDVYTHSLVEVRFASEVDFNMIICIAALYGGLTSDKVRDYSYYPPLSEMRHYLRDLNIGYTPERGAYNWGRSGDIFEQKVRRVWLACMAIKNFGDWHRIDRLPKVDMWAFGPEFADVDELKRLLEIGAVTGSLPKFLCLESEELMHETFLDDYPVIVTNLREVNDVLR